MMKNILYAILGTVLFFSCSRRDLQPAPGIEGTWKMVRVFESNTNRLHEQPNGSRDVVIAFHRSDPSGGTITGYTPTNQIYASNYSATANGNLSIPALNMTKVAENTWGRLFVDYITAAQRYHVEGGSLWITTANSKLVFRRP